LELQNGLETNKLFNNNTLIWEYNNKHHFYGDIILDGNVFEMNGLKIDNGKILTKIEINDLIVNQLTFGKTTIKPNEIIIDSDKFKFNCKEFLIDDKIIIKSNIEISENLIFGKNIVINDQEFKINNIDINISNCNWNCNDSDIKIHGKKMIYDNVEVIFRISEKTSIRIKDDIMLFDKNSILKVDGEIQIGGIILKETRIMTSDMRLIIGEDKMELKKYDMDMNDIKINKKGGYINIEENDFIIKNSRLKIDGETDINGLINIKNGQISIYDGVMNFENSKMRIGGLELSKEKIHGNNIMLKWENSEIIRNNIICTDDKVTNDILNGTINIKNSKVSYISEGTEILNISKNIKINTKLCINEGLEFIGNQMIMKDYKIDYQDGKYTVNPNFMKIKNYKFVLENSVFLYKEENTTLMIEKNILYADNFEIKLKDCLFEWMDKSGNKIIEIKQNLCNLLKIDMIIKESIIQYDKNDIIFLNNNININGGNIILENYKISDSNNLFNITPGNWELNGIKLEYNKGTHKSNGVIFEKTLGKEMNKDMEITYTKSKLCWIDEKNKNVLFIGDKLMQINFPVVEYNNVDINFKNKEGNVFGRIMDNDIKIENTKIIFQNTHIYVEKNGFPILNINGDEVSIKNVPLKIEDSFINYLYSRKNAQLLIKNDLMFLSYMDIEMKNSSFNWNNKFNLIGNKMKINDLEVEINSKINWKNKKGKIEFDEKLLIEDISVKFMKGNSQFLEINNGTIRLEGAMMIKNGQFYNECMTLDPNCLKLEEAFFRMKKVDMYMENTKMILILKVPSKLGKIQLEKIMD